MAELIDMGTVSSRGQVAIPSKIRNQMGLKEGSKLMFFLGDDTLVMKKVENRSFAELTAPLKKAKKKIRESQVPDLIHKLRREKR
tara:strand:+ start:1203 stop:1457 length:255 start_codon:yes stop_codon:yes gene_type:complete